MRKVKHLNRSPRKAVESSFLETFKTQMDTILSNLLWPVELWAVGQLDYFQRSPPTSDIVRYFISHISKSNGLSSHELKHYRKEIISKAL